MRYASPSWNERLTKVLLLILILMLLFGCGSKSRDTNEVLSDVQRVELQQRMESIQPWAQYCDGVSKDNCSVGDSTLFNGLACISGDEQACSAALRSQGPTGQVYRHPSRVMIDKEDSSSRDMVLGFLLTITHKRDKAAAKRFQAYFEETGKFCTDATDGRCNITEPMLGLMYHVWTFLDLKPSASMQLNRFILSSTLKASALTVPPGFQLHLVSVQAALLQETGQDAEYLTGTLISRQPENPWFQYLHGNYRLAAEQLLKKAPQLKPAERFQWSFERDTAEGAEKDSMGHEFLMLIRLLLAK